MHVSVSLQKHKGFFLHFDSDLKSAKISATMHFFQTQKKITGENFKINSVTFSPSGNQYSNTYNPYLLHYLAIVCSLWYLLDTKFSNRKWRVSFLNQFVLN